MGRPVKVPTIPGKEFSYPLQVDITHGHIITESTENGGIKSWQVVAVEYSSKSLTVYCVPVKHKYITVHVGDKYVSATHYTLDTSEAE